MRLKQFTILIVFIFCSFVINAQTGKYIPELARFDSAMSNLLSKYKLAGGQLAITYQGRLVYNRGFGYADTSSKSLVQPNSIFRLASVSKSITSIAIMKLYEKGLLNLDDKVFGTTGILNDTMYQSAIDARIYNITIRQLLNHSSGFKFDFATEPLWKTYDIANAMGVSPPTYSFELVLKWTLMNMTLGYNPGTSVFYSNFGYTLLGLVIEKISGMKYEDFVQKNILLPLGITDMHAGKTLYENRFSNEVSYYEYPGAPLSTSIFTGIPNSVPAPYGGYNWEIMTPCGGWVASAHDLCKLLVAVDRYNTKPDILLTSTIDTMTTKSANWPEYALGWFVNGDGYWHTGGIQGTASVIQSNSKYQLNYAILFNTLPEKYTPLYLEFMTMVTDDFEKIETWPEHDLFSTTSIANAESGNNSETIFPNPATDYIIVDLGNYTLKGVVENEEIRIFNVFGECVESTPISLRDANPAKEGNKYRINISALPAGVYLVRVGERMEKFNILR